MSRNIFWNELGIRLISLLCAVVIAAMLICIIVPADVQTLTLICEITACVLALAWAVSVAAMTRRRLRDAGFGAKSYLWLLLPVAGLIVFLYRLCAKSAEETK